VMVIGTAPSLVLFLHSEAGEKGRARSLHGSGSRPSGPSLPLREDQLTSSKVVIHKDKYVGRLP
jgi:hypothetical protein